MSQKNERRRVRRRPSGVGIRKGMEGGAGYTGVIKVIVPVTAVSA
ncbi:hypothetical protein PAPH110629_01210 [Paenibacillus phoenicis]